MKIPDDRDVILGSGITVGMLKGYRRPAFWAEMMQIPPITDLTMFKSAGHPVDRPCTFSQFLDLYQDYDDGTRHNSANV